jgi:hypothetical protein
MADRDGLVARVRRVRRSSTDAGAPAVDSEAGRGTPDDRVDALEARVADLERLVEGLQDSVHRESERHSKLIAELQEQIKPGAMGAALAEDARSRGL